MAAVKEKRVEDSMIEQVHKLRPTHMNGMGRLFGGQLMSWIDEVACLVGNRHSQANVITASVDNLRFIRGAYVNELIVMIAKMTYVALFYVKANQNEEFTARCGTRPPRSAAPPRRAAAFRSPPRRRSAAQAPRSAVRGQAPRRA